MFKSLSFHNNYSYAYCSLSELHSLIVFVSKKDKLGFKVALGFFLVTNLLAVMNGSNASCILQHIWLEDLSSQSSISFSFILCFLILHWSGEFSVLINSSLKITVFFHPRIVSVTTNRNDKTASHLSETSSWLSEPYGLHNRFCRLDSPLLWPWVATRTHIKWVVRMVWFSIQSG